jgi:hypothetical protein
MQIAVVLHMLEFILQHPRVHMEDRNLAKDKPTVEKQIQHVPAVYVEKAIRLVKTSMLQRQCFEADSAVFEVYRISSSAHHVFLPCSSRTPD